MRDRPHLSVRQFQIMQCILEGMNSKDIAEELEMEVKTVKAHKNRLYNKFGIGDQWDKAVRLVWILSGGVA